MKYSSLVAVLALVGACSGGNQPNTGPTPAERPAPQAPTPAQPAPAPVAMTPPIDSTPPSTPAPVLADSAVQADSAKDAAVLDVLTSAEPGPDSLSEDSLATEEITYDIDVTTYGEHKRVKYWLDFFQGPARERMTVWLQRQPKYESMIRAKMRDYSVPEDMVYLALIESGFSNSAVSRARATGMWQFMKGTGKLYGLRIDSWVDERRDPVRATDAAARHLADLRDRFGSMYLAAAAYNAGAGKVGRGMKRMGAAENPEDEEEANASFFRLYDTRYIRQETKDYVPKLIAAALIAKQPEKYGFERATGIEALAYDSIIVPDATGLDVIARLADTNLAALRELNPQYIRLVTPPRQTSVIRLPVGLGDLAGARYAAMPEKSRINYIEHVVVKGQTVSAIARTYRVTTSLIADANPGVRVNRLRPGTHLVIPTSYVPPVAEPSAPRAKVTPVRGSSSTTIRYKVRSGESLWTIAEKYNTTIEKLRSMNALTRHESLKAGQVIRVPAPADSVKAEPTRVAVKNSKLAPAAGSGARSHLVRRGETLTSIASRYQVSLSELRSANGMTTRSVLKAGDRLVIP
jgi:membrane-bound lytic murein transglycosylase D